jgi:peptidoglycan/LPS O-acetylase OafA/YrhL
MLNPAVPAKRSGTHVYATLDGLRGVAAMLIAIRHAAPLFPGWELPHSPLAVDMFFVISGFVIASAYDHRLAGGLTPTGFMRLRLIRLYPLYLAGLLLGLAAGILCWLTGTDPRLNGLALAASFLLGLFILPSPAIWNNETFPLNPPSWSLFFELAINYIYAVAYKKITTSRLIGIVGVHAIFLLGITLYGINLDEGHSWTYFTVGVARVVFSFSVGLLLFQFRRRFDISSLGAILIIGLAAITLAMPELGRWYSLIAVTIWMPAIIFLATAVEPGAAVRRICLLLGQVSYPLYVLHSPAAVIAESALAKAGFGSPAAVTGLAFLGAMMVIALLMDRLSKALIGDRFRAEFPRIFPARNILDSPDRSPDAAPGNAL